MVSRRTALRTELKLIHLVAWVLAHASFQGCHLLIWQVGNSLSILIIGNEKVLNFHGCHVLSHFFHANLTFLVTLLVLFIFSCFLLFFIKKHLSKTTLLPRTSYKCMVNSISKPLQEWNCEWKSHVNILSFPILPKTKITFHLHFHFITTVD